jgi:hypothetical protein
MLDDLPAILPGVGIWQRRVRFLARVVSDFMQPF